MERATQRPFIGAAVTRAVAAATALLMLLLVGVVLVAARSGSTRVLAPDLRRDCYLLGGDPGRGTFLHPDTFTCAIYPRTSP